MAGEGGEGFVVALGREWLGGVDLEGRLGVGVP